MTLQNRVMPNGQIIKAPWRGSMMGNRGGRIHNPETKTLTKRKWASKRWICCVLEFKRRQRSIMGESYTELFFLDEVSALACGHRPCFECRRQEANHFADAWQSAFGPFLKSRADSMDAILQIERTGSRPLIRKQDLDTLPTGAIIRCDGKFFAHKNETWLEWSGNGYMRIDKRLKDSELITPPSILKTFENGYTPRWHESAS